MLYEDEVMGKDAPREAAPSASDSEEKKKNKKKELLLFLRDVVIAVAVIVVVLQFVRPMIVFETSMENTLHPKDYVFLAKQAYTFGEVERGDIVVFKSDMLDTHGVKKNLIKRVIALPGDTIEIANDRVYLNGEPLIEPYTKDGVTTGVLEPLTVPEGEYFVMGDNRAVSIDSRSPSVGCVSEDRLAGKVFFRLFPFSGTGKIR